MSHYMTALAMKQKGLKPAAKIVLYWLADHHNGETNRCFPSLARLADLCEMSKRSVQTQLDHLAEQGLIKKSLAWRDDGQQTSNNYELLLEGVQDLLCGVEKSATLPMQDLLGNNLVSSNQGSQRRARALPDDWVPNDKNIDDAIKRGFSDKEISHEAEQFRNYHHAKGSKFKVWDAAWRTWLGNSRKFAQASTARSRGATDSLLAGFGSYANKYGN